MEKTCLLILCLIALVFAGCKKIGVSIFKPPLSHSAQEKRDMMIGRWYGEIKDEKGAIQRWLVDRSKDGTYQILFRIYENGTDVE